MTSPPFSSIPQARHVEPKQFQARLPVITGEAHFKGVLAADGLLAGQLGSGSSLSVKQRPASLITSEPELYGDISFKNGRVEQGNFNDYPLVRIDESPRETRVHIVEHSIDVHPSGVGEPGVPPFAPALCNAIFAATGKRLRKLPVDCSVLKQSA